MKTDIGQAASKRVTIRGIALRIASVVAFTAWMAVVYSYVIPFLWGPYAMAMGDAGPLMLTRGGSIILLGAVPWVAIFIAIASVRAGFGTWFKIQLTVLPLLVFCIICYGYYLHSIVSWQGLDSSVEYLAAEVGYRNSDDVPSHIKSAFAQSVALNDAGKKPWLPGAWKTVDWPVAPTSQQR